MSNFPLVTDSERGLNRYFMRIWTMTAVVALGFSSFAADNVAPTRAELEEMYNGAYKAFDAKKFSEALKQLDAIDARQPDLAASRNLRGVILMRQGNYDQAETTFQEAAKIDPKFWNARFNLAQIPFLKKDWGEARKRFDQLLSSGESDLAKEASQLIQYKILLTYLLEGKENMVDSIQAKLELSPDTPAVDYVKAAVALKQKNQKEAKDWIGVAEKNFSPQLNKLFAESLYEVGWLEKPAGETRPSLPLMTAAERSEKTKATARAKFEQAQQALRQRDQAAELIKFKIYLTLLLEGKESRAHAMMDEFQFTGDTPALYYAQAAWEFQHNNPEKASDWTSSANKIYSSALNSVFADAFYDVGWMQRPAAATMPTPAFDTAQAEGSPAVEPSPIPDKVFAANSQSDTSKGEGLALGSTASASGAGLDIAGTGTAARTSISASNESASGTGSQPQQPASASSSGGSESTAAASSAASPQPSAGSTEQNDQAALAQTSVSPSPAAEVMPVKAAPSGILARGRMWLVGGLLLVALLILAWVIVPTLRRRYVFDVPSYSRAPSAAAPALFKPKVASASPQKKTLQGFVGGPRQISLQLKASKPALRHGVVPSRDLSRGFDLTKG